MKMEELKVLTEDQLGDKLSSLRKEALNLRFQKAGGELKDSSKIRKIRKLIAKVMTVLNKNKQGKE